MQCAFIKPDSNQCQAYAMSRGPYCYLHSSDVSEEEKREAQSRGGSATHVDRTQLLEPADMTDTKAVLYILADTINRVRRIREDGSMDVKTANAIGHLASKMLEAQKIMLLEKQVLDFRGHSRNNDQGITHERAKLMLEEVLAERQAA